MFLRSKNKLISSSLIPIIGNKLLLILIEEGHVKFPHSKWHPISQHRKYSDSLSSLLAIMELSSLFRNSILYIYSFCNSKGSSINSASIAFNNSVYRCTVGLYFRSIVANSCCFMSYMCSSRCIAKSNSVEIC